MPTRDGRRHIDRQLALPHQDAEQRVGHRLCDRETRQWRFGTDARGIAFANDAAVFDDHDRFDVARNLSLLLDECAIERRPQTGIGSFERRNLREGRLVRQRRRQPDAVCVFEPATVARVKHRPGRQRAHDRGFNGLGAAIDVDAQQRRRNRRHRLDRLIERLGGIETRNKGRRTQRLRRHA